MEQMKFHGAARVLIAFGILFVSASFLSKLSGVLPGTETQSFIWAGCFMALIGAVVAMVDRQSKNEAITRLTTESGQTTKVILDAITEARKDQEAMSGQILKTLQERS